MTVVPILYRSSGPGASTLGSFCSMMPSLWPCSTASCAARIDTSRASATCVTAPGNITTLRTGTISSTSSGKVGVPGDAASGFGETGFWSFIVSCP